MTHVLITDSGFPHLDAERAVLTAAGATVSAAQCKTAEEVIAAAANAEILIVQWAPITRAVLAALPRLRLVVRYGIGVDNVDLAAAGERGIPVCNVPDYCLDEVADHTMALALSLSRQLPQTDAVMRQGTWKITPPAPAPALRGRVFATAGFGRIARAVLARATAFGCTPAAYDPFVSTEAFAAAGVRALSVDELFNQSGILSLHLPLGESTRHFVNAQRLAQMHRDAVLINTARGGLIDTVALASALDAGTIAAAGIDVFEQEPLPAEHPLRRSRNTLLTSHTAWYSTASIPALQQRAAETAALAVRGLPLRHVVNQAFLRPNP